MRALSLVTAALALAALGSGSAHAEVRYIVLSGDVMGDLPAEAIVKETHQGSKIVATEIDVCYSVTAATERKDRFVIALKSDGQKLTGSGQSLEDKQPIAVDLTRKVTGKALAFEGTIKVGATSIETLSPDNTDLSEAEFKENQAVDDGIAAAPADFTEVSPGSLAFKVKRAAFADFVKGLRAQNVKIALYSLVQDCQALRSGEQVVRFDVDPDRAPAVLAKLKTAPGIVSAGWAAGIYDMDRAARFPAAPWRDGGKLNRDKLGPAIADIVAKALAAKPSSAVWDDNSGELTLKLKRPSQSVPALDLTETIELTALVGPEKPGASDRLVVWLSGPTIETTDESAGTHLTFTGSSNGGGEGLPIDNGETVDALAKEFKGQRWDTENSRWK